MFESLGITDATLQIYRALLDEPQSTPGDLELQTGFPASQVESSLNRLRELKLLVPGWSGGAEFALHPNLGFSILSQHRRRQLAQLTDDLHQDELQAELITQQYNDSMRLRDEREIEIVEGHERANQRIGEFRPMRSMWGFNTTAKESLAREYQYEDDSPDAALLNRGLDFRCIYLTSSAGGKKLNDYLRWVHQKGGQVRTAPSLPMKLLIYDGSSIVMPLDPDHHTAGLVVHHGKAVVTLAVAMFEYYWQHSARLFDPAPGSPGDLNPQELEFLQLLVQGATDEQVGRKLGVSLRTVRRMAAKLSEQAGASGRFELGVRAAQRGWVK